MRKFVQVVLACVIVCFASGQAAFAHAHLLSSIPSANGTIRGPDVSIDLKFNSQVDSSRSHLDLVLPSGNVEALKISAPSIAELGARAHLSPGKYMIRWQALSTDGHITRGEIPFTVR